MYLGFTSVYGQNQETFLGSEEMKFSVIFYQEMNFRNQGKNELKNS